MTCRFCSPGAVGILLAAVGILVEFAYLLHDVMPGAQRSFLEILGSRLVTCAIHGCISCSAEPKWQQTGLNLQVCSFSSCFLHALMITSHRACQANSSIQHLHVSCLSSFALRVHGNFGRTVNRVADGTQQNVHGSENATLAGICLMQHSSGEDATWNLLHIATWLSSDSLEWQLPSQNASQFKLQNRCLSSPRCISRHKGRSQADRTFTSACPCLSASCKCHSRTQLAP